MLATNTSTMHHARWRWCCEAAATNNTRRHAQLRTKSSCCYKRTTHFALCVWQQCTALLLLSRSVYVHVLPRRRRLRLFLLLLHRLLLLLPLPLLLLLL